MPVATTANVIVANVKPYSNAVLFFEFVGVSVKVCVSEKGAEYFVAPHFVIHIGLDSVGQFPVIVRYHIDLHSEFPLDSLVDYLSPLAVEVGLELLIDFLHSIDFRCSIILLQTPCQNSRGRKRVPIILLIAYPIHVRTRTIVFNNVVVSNLDVLAQFPNEWLD